MYNKSPIQEYFDKISTIEEFIEAEKMGFSIDFITNIPEMPGATFFHQACRCCYLDLIKFLCTNRQININMLDEDGCSPLGYIINDDVVTEAELGYQISTVNLGCEDPQLIISTINYLISIGCEAIYYDKKYSSDFVNSYIDLLKNNA
jgi:hypothetical protein